MISDPPRDIGSCGNSYWIGVKRLVNWFAPPQGRSKTLLIQKIIASNPHCRQINPAMCNWMVGWAGLCYRLNAQQRSNNEMQRLVRRWSNMLQRLMSTASRHVQVAGHGFNRKRKPKRTLVEHKKKNCGLSCLNLKLPTLARAYNTVHSLTGKYWRWLCGCKCTGINLSRIFGAGTNYWKKGVSC